MVGGVRGARGAGVKDRLKRYALFERFGADHFYPTIGTAVRAYLDATGVDWTEPAPLRDEQ